MSSFLNGRYEKINELKGGAMGIVALVKDIKDNNEK